MGVSRALESWELPSATTVAAYVGRYLYTRIHVPVSPTVHLPHLNSTHNRRSSYLVPCPGLSTQDMNMRRRLPPTARPQRDLGWSVPSQESKHAGITGGGGPADGPMRTHWVPLHTVPNCSLSERLP